MAKTTDEITVECPAPTYRFRVNVGAEQCWAGTVSGLDNTREWTSRGEMGGLLSVTLSQMRIATNSRLVEWLAGRPGAAEKRDITINLMGAKDNELFITWTVTNAFPSVASGFGVDANRNELVVSQVVLQCERVTMTAH